MSKKDTQHLIKKLAAKGLPPVKLAPNPVIVGALLSLFCGLFVMSSVAYFGMRADFGTVWHTPLFRVEVLLALLTGVFGMFAANWLALPDMRQQRWVCWLPFLTFAGLSSVILYRFLAMPEDAFSPIGIGHCFNTVVAVALVPAVVLILQMRRMATVHSKLAGLTAFLPALSFGYIPARVMCPNDEVMHLMVDHMGAVVVGSLVGLIVGYRLFRW